MVAKSDTDLDLNEEFFAVRKRNLSNEERIRRIRDIQRGRAMKKPVQRDTIIPRMSPSEWADFAEVEQPRPAPPQEAGDEPEPEVDEAEVEIEEVDPEPAEQPEPDDALEEALDSDEDGEDADDSDIDYGPAEEIVADIPEAETPPTEVEPEDFVESPVNTTEALDTEGVLIDAYIRQEGDDFTPVTGGITLEMALEIDGKDGYLHTLGDGEKEFYFGITREEYDALNKSNWSVIENPFANPFFDTSAFAIRKDRPRGFVSPVPLPPIDEIQKEVKPPELNGFQTNKEDDLSLLPSSMLIKDNSVGDDLSLLPAGWKND